MDGLEGNTRLLQLRLKFRNAAAGIVHHHVESIAGDYQARDSLGMFELRTQAKWFGRNHRKHAFPELDFRLLGVSQKSNLP